jgi:hypothetical protein
MNLKPYKDYYSISPSRHIALYTPASLEYTVYIIIIRIISLHRFSLIFHPKKCQKDLGNQYKHFKANQMGQKPQNITCRKKKFRG